MPLRVVGLKSGSVGVGARRSEAKLKPNDLTPADTTHHPSPAIPFRQDVDCRQ